VTSQPPSFLGGAVTASTASLLTSIDELDPDDVGEPTELPGWSRGHVLTHLARNADALLRMLVGALGGTSLPMYPSIEARNADIAAGAVRPAEVIFQDVRITAETFGVAVGEVQAATWSTVVTLLPPLGPMEGPVSEILEMRLREVEIHHADLAVGHDFSTTDPVTLDHLIAGTVERFRHRVTTPIRLAASDTGHRYTIIGTDTSTEGFEIELPAAALYRQLTGRLSSDDEPGALPGLPPWQ
jgi:maleylpyruvate isomerase